MSVHQSDPSLVSSTFSPSTLCIYADLYRRALKHVIFSTQGDAKSLWESLVAVRTKAVVMLDGAHDSVRVNKHPSSSYLLVPASPLTFFFLYDLRTTRSNFVV